MCRIAIAIASLLYVCGSQALAMPPLSLAERVALQTQMRQVIDSRLVDGRYLHLDPETLELVSLYPAKAHPMILRFDNNFVLCTDFLTEEGRPVNVDFYVAKGGNELVVFDTVIDNRAPVEALMKRGRIAVAD